MLNRNDQMLDLLYLILKRLNHWILDFHLLEDRVKVLLKKERNDVSSVFNIKYPKEKQNTQDTYKFGKSTVFCTFLEKLKYLDGTLQNKKALFLFIRHYLEIVLFPLVYEKCSLNLIR